MENVTRQQKKKFALAQIKPYYENRELCGIDTTGCCYLTANGTMCVAGKNLIDPKQYMGTSKAIEYLLNKEQTILKPESRGILTNQEWGYLQNIHDRIARNDIDGSEAPIKRLNLFTLKELTK